MLKYERLRRLGALKKSALCCIAVACSVLLFGQDVCSGNFGENSFTTGDFGSGFPVLVTTNPGLAPGFNYSTNVPLDDGQYVLTNDMGKWANNYDTWVAIQDNSSDPFGYMMVVNASFSPGIFYEQTVVDLCPNTFYEVTFDVINIVRRPVPNHILPDLTLLLDDVVVLNTGSIAQDETWRSFNYSFTTTADSVKVTLRNNAPGGIGNDLAIDNIRFRPCGPEAQLFIDIDGRICENGIFPTISGEVDAPTQGSGFQWQISYDSGINWEDIPGATSNAHQVQQLSAGVYLFRYLWASVAANISNPLCRTISDFLVVEVVPIEYEIVDTLCEGLAFDLGGVLYNTSGVYQEHLISSIGCDSIVTLYLTIKEDPNLTFESEIQVPSCPGDADGLVWLTEINANDGPFDLSVPSQKVQYPDSLYLAAGAYDLVVTDRHGCSGEESIEISDPEVFVIAGLQDTTVILGYTLEVTPSFNYPPQAVSWQGQYLDCLNCPQPNARPLNGQVYTIMATNQFGCTAEASFRIDVDKRTRIYCPNVFTPNNDGINDVWVVTIDENTVDMIDELVITDRWGGIVFQRRQLPPEMDLLSWDGTSNGEPVPVGVYTYAIQMILPDGQRSARGGTITVL